MLKNENGFTLAQVMVAAGLLGALSLAFMQITKNIGQTQNFAQTKSDELELRSSIRMILDDERYCRVSLAGNGPLGTPSSPVIFEKQDIDEETEGLDIALYLSDQAGETRTTKKYNGENNPGSDDKSKFGKLKIKSLKLIMNNGTGSNYSNSAVHNDIGIIRAIIEKKISTSKMRQLIMDFDVNISMATGQSPETSGESRIISCSREDSSQFTVDINQVSAAIPSQSGTTPSYGYATCPSDRIPVSCGFEKIPSTGSQDDIGCFIDHAGNRCAGWRDQDSGTDPNLTVFCYCMMR